MDAANRRPSVDELNAMADRINMVAEKFDTCELAIAEHVIYRDPQLVTMFNRCRSQNDMVEFIRRRAVIASHTVSAFANCLEGTCTKSYCSESKFARKRKG